MHRTYVIPESMNAQWGSPPYHAEGVVVKRMGQIKKSKERVVFLEERRISGDTFIFIYKTDDTASPHVYWDGDNPNIMHGNGANFGFADGHADYHGWVCPTTLEIANRPLSAPMLLGTAYDPYWSRAVTECGNVDAKWMENAVWGVSVP